MQTPRKQMAHRTDTVVAATLSGQVSCSRREGEIGTKGRDALDPVMRRVRRTPSNLVVQLPSPAMRGDLEPEGSA